MKRALLSVLFASVSLACGSSAPPPPNDPGKAQEPTATAPKNAGPCVATLTGEKGTGWVPAGSLAISVTEKEVTKVELKDVAGKVVPTENTPKDKDADFKSFIVASTCKVGGVFAVIDEQKNKGAAAAKSGTLVIDLYRPEKDDEPGDVALLCARPPILDKAPKDLDPSQEIRIAASFYEESLTSQKWRSWLMTMSRDLSKAEEEKVAVGIKTAKAEELERAGKAAGKGSCWFANGLRGK